MNLIILKYPIGKHFIFNNSGQSRKIWHWTIVSLNYEFFWHQNVEERKVEELKRALLYSIKQFLKNVMCCQKTYKLVIQYFFILNADQLS